VSFAARPSTYALTKRDLAWSAGFIRSKIPLRAVNDLAGYRSTVRLTIRELAVRVVPPLNHLCVLLMVKPDQIRANFGIASEDDRLYIPLNSAGEARITHQFRAVLRQLERLHVLW
jgi:hypothetical protein